MTLYDDSIRVMRKRLQAIPGEIDKLGGEKATLVAKVSRLNALITQLQDERTDLLAAIQELKTT